MIIKYKLMTATMRGIMTDIEPILLDIDSEIQLSFFMSNGKPAKNLYAVIEDSTGQQHKFKIMDGKLLLPANLAIPQILHLVVLQIEKGEIQNRWECQSLKISRLNDISKLKFEAGATFEELASIVQVLEYEANTQTELLNAIQAKYEALSAQLEALIETVNNSANGINNLSERVEFIEQNYNPLNT